ncbi:MAG: exonuclease domain-containing protein [Promethearchaeia archaeon]
MNSFLDWEKNLDLKKDISLEFESKSNGNKLGIPSALFKDYVKNWVKKYLEENLIIVLDIETTHTKPILGMIVEIGLCFLDLNSGKIDPIFNIICQEEDIELDPDAWIFNNSDLNIEEVMQAPYLSEFREELQSIFDLGYPITAFNQKFDFGWLYNRDFRISNRFWDPMLKLTPIMRIPHDYYIYKYPSVEEAWRYLFPDIEYKEKHRALDDAIHEAKIIHAVYRMLEGNNHERK